MADVRDGASSPATRMGQPISQQSWWWVEGCSAGAAWGVASSEQMTCPAGIAVRWTVAARTGASSDCSANAYRSAITRIARLQPVWRVRCLMRKV